MIKYILLAAASMLPFAAAQAQPAMSWEDTVKESIDATQVPDMPLAPDGTVTPNDLILDLNFNGTGMQTTQAPVPTGFTSVNDGLRVFPYTACFTLPPHNVPICMHSGYYLFGRQKATNGTWRAWLTRIKLDGSRDTTFGTDGWMYPFTSNDLNVADAVITSDRIYTLSTMTLATPVIRITCTELATGDSCFTGFGGIITFGATTTGAIRSAYGQRIVYDSRYGLFVGGYVKTVARGWEMAVARVDTANGTLVTEFRGDGTNIGLPSWAAQTDSNIDVYDMAIAPPGAPGGERLYIAGKAKRNATNHDGYVLGLNPTTGATSTGWGWNAIFHETDNLGYKQDAVTAITVQRNGRLAMAGWSETNTAGEKSMILGRLKTNGDKDLSFCDGFGVCKRNDPWPNVIDKDLPAAIAERDGTRDLVVALRHQRPTASDQRPRQVLQQFGSSGNRKHAQRTLDYAARAGVTRNSQPFGMWIGHTGAYGLGGEVVAIVGTRLWSSTSFDATLGHLISTDSIFADQFGGKQGD